MGPPPRMYIMLLVDGFNDLVDPVLIFVGPVRVVGGPIDQSEFHRLVFVEGQVLLFRLGKESYLKYRKNWLCLPFYSALGLVYVKC